MNSKAKFLFDMRPTKEMEGALTGALTLDEISPASVSALGLRIYSEACNILLISTNERKRLAIESWPVGIQALLRAECRRLYDMRRNNE